MSVHAPAVRLHDVAHDREPETEPVLLALAALGLLKPIEDMRQELGSDAAARIADHDFGVRVHALQGDFDPAAARREFDRVRQEVPDHLQQAVRIARYGFDHLVDAGVDAHALGIGRGADGPDRLFDDARQYHRLHVQTGLA